MEKKKTFRQRMRALHRDVGYFVVGFVIVYSLSGIVLTYRGKDVFKRDVIVERELSPGLEPAELGNALRMRNFEPTKTEGDVVYFQNGSYNTSSGVATITVRDVVPPLNKFIGLHKTESSSYKHLTNIIFGICILFLSISSFWMFNTKTKFFKRGIIIAGAGILITLFLVFL